MPRAAPPEHSRFRKGQSGNPKGRPKKQAAKATGSAFDIIIDRTLTGMRNGAPREMSVDEALEQRTYEQALAGDRLAQRAVFRMIARRETVLRERNPQKHKAVEVLRGYGDTGNADAALLLLGIAARDSRRDDWALPERHLLLEPWAVEAALKRRPAKRLTKRDLAEARRCARDADALVWPEPVEP